jgi:hypothetical protein
MGDKPITNVPEDTVNPLANLSQGVRGYWQPSGKFFVRCHRVSATCKQILQRELATFSKSIHLLPILSNSLPDGFECPLEQVAWGIG